MVGRAGSLSQQKRKERKKSHDGQRSECVVVEVGGKIDSRDKAFLDYTKSDRLEHLLLKENKGVRKGKQQVG